MMAARALLLASVLVTACPCAFALNPALDISQYSHHAWTIRDGFFHNVTTSIAQTPDGYLWLGSELGLVRFDGVRPVPWQPAGQSLPDRFIYSLLAARDGRLWIGTLRGLASWKNGMLTQYSEFAGALISAVFEDHEGTVWVGTNEVHGGRLCAIRNGAIRCYGQDGSLGQGVDSVYEANGALWASTAAGVWQWSPAPPKLYPLPWIGRSFPQGLSDDSGRLLISMLGGLRQIRDGRVDKYPMPSGFSIDPKQLLRDRDGGLWIGTSAQGLLHLHDGKTDRFDRADGLSNDAINAIFQDREGSIWVATSGGIDRFRDFAIPSLSVKEGLSQDSLWSVLATRDGSVWLGSRNGLNRWKDGQVTVYTRGKNVLDVPLSLFQDHRERVWAPTWNAGGYFENGYFVHVYSLPKGQVHCIAEDSNGNIFFCYDDALVELCNDGAVRRTPWPQLGHRGYVTTQIPDPIQGGMWLGSRFDGVTYFKDGQVLAAYSADNGLGKGFVTDFEFDHDGVLWVSTEGGLSRIKNGRVMTLTSARGLPCDNVHWMREDDQLSVWLYMSCGLVRLARSELDAWAGNPSHTVQTSTIDNSGGVGFHAVITGYSPAVTKTADGKFWFLGGEGVSVLDPHHIVINRMAPPVQIEQIKADGKTYEARQGSRLPALVRNVSIDYTALSLAAPERVRFRYKLEGQDPDWREVINERSAEYSNLRPRNYRFRVIASNNDGVWNEAGSSLEFSIAPAYYQTGWFQAAIAACVLALLWGLYRYRVYQVARQFNMRLDERLGERTRIARDLHDTLLQSFQGLLFEFQAARNLFSRRPEEAMRTLDDAIGSAEAAIAEGRDAIQNLRASSRIDSDLARLLAAAGKELSAARDWNVNGAAFRLTVEGPPQVLSPILQDEVYGIVREILRNAFRHACPGNVEVEVRYDDRMLRVRIRDDGIGIDPKVLKEGARDGHWGLPGVRERAKLIGAKLDFWSEPGAGTEVQLMVPASVAYDKSGNGRASRWMRKVTGYHGD